MTDATTDPMRTNPYGRAVALLAVVTLLSSAVLVLTPGSGRAETDRPTVIGDGTHCTEFYFEYTDDHDDWFVVCADNAVVNVSQDGTPGSVRVEQLHVPELHVSCSEDLVPVDEDGDTVDIGSSDLHGFDAEHRDLGEHLVAVADGVTDGDGDPVPAFRVDKRWTGDDPDCGWVDFPDPSPRSATIAVTKTLGGLELGDQDPVFSFELFVIGEGSADSLGVRDTSGTIEWDVAVPDDYRLCETDLPDGYVTIWPDDERLEESAPGGDPCVEFTVTGEDPRFEIPVDNDVLVSIPGVEEPGIDLVKVADLGEAEVGDVITYTYTVTNTGDVTLTDITLDDDLLGAIELGSTALEPGGSTTGTATHTVTADDLEVGEIHNVATTLGRPPEGGAVSDSDVATVIVFEEAVAPQVLEPAPATDELPATGSDNLALLVWAVVALGLGAGVLVAVPRWSREAI